MFIDDLKKLIDIQYIDQSVYSELFDMYQRNIEYMDNKDLKSGLEVYNSTLEKVKDIKGERHYFFVRIGEKCCAIIDCFLGYPDENAVYLRYFLVDKAYHNFEIGKEIMRDFTSLALKNYNEVVLDCNIKDTKVIQFWNSLGFIVSETLDKYKIRLKSID